MKLFHQLMNSYSDELILEKVKQQNSKFETWVNNQLFSDFTFYIGKAKTPFFAHKFILKTCSFFQTYESQTNATFSHMNPDSFYEVLHFIYTKRLSKKMKESLCLEIANIGRYFELSLLEKLCFAYIQENSYNFLKSEQFLKISDDTLLNLLQSQIIQDDESDIFDSIVNWARNNKPSLELMENILKNLRLTLIPLEKLEILEENNWISEDTLLEILKRIYIKDIEESRGSKRFVYTSDFDDKGILHYIGTKEGKDVWQNPMQLGLVTVTSFGQNNLYGNLFDLVSKNQANLWLGTSKDSAFQIDFGEYRVKLTDYTLRSFTQNCCYLRGWNIEGSNDGISWSIIQKHDEMTNFSFTVPNQTKTFQILETQKIFYKHIRIHNIKQNSSNWNFGCANFECYGYLKKK